MPVPSPDTNHVSEALALLTSRYASAPVVRGIVKALTLRLQEVENTFQSLLQAIQLSNHPMPGGPWNILDQLGALVGAPRNGLSDAAYVAVIKLHARVNRSRGTSEDVLKLAVLLAAPNPPVYLEYWSAAFYIGAWNFNPGYVSTDGAVALLIQARAAGVYGVLAYSTWAPGNDFSYSSVYDATAGEAGYGSVYDPSAGGLMVAGVGL